jgi:Zn-dependent protease with chaperone function
MSNIFKTAFLLTAMTLLLMLAGRAFGGQNGMLMALVFAVVMNFVAYFFSDKIALATKKSACRCPRFTLSPPTRQTPSPPDATQITRP